MRSTDYAPNFKTPNSQMPSRRMWLIVALCVILPPVGLFLLWTQARNPLRGKLIISIIAVLSMTLMLTIYISVRDRNAYQMQQLPPDVPALMDLGGSNVQQPSEVAPAQPNLNETLQDPNSLMQPTPVPANPNPAG
ncbi:hypothetical protein LJC33_04060 [Eubacteriales bacterium OttesenSCG-928-N13]|nr:hypothetical protein [Eubacteriales bacterium OttesenSCG-928-N13]